MSEVRLVVRDSQGDWSGKIHGSCADHAVAALSADPVTLAELEAAAARFAKPFLHSRFFGNLSPGLCDEPYDAGLVVIDLVARLVTVDSTYSHPGSKGAVWYHNGECGTTTQLPYHLADDWRFTSDGYNWQAVADARRRELAERPPLDARAVFYGRPMLEFIAREAFAAFARRDEIAAAVRTKWLEKARQRLANADNVSPDDIDPSRLTDEEIEPKTWPGEEEYASPFYDTLKEIHAAWLLTPRDDLGGASPREVALERHGHINWDLQDQCQRWSILGHCPPGLEESCFAFRYGGFGTHELVKYYYLVRELLWCCWERLSEFSETPASAERLKMFTAGDFLIDEIPRLERLRDEWLDTPDPECHGRTPRSIIHRERARLPEAVSGEEAMIDSDCPCCQMMADMPGPMFWHLDGCNMDHEFAFDLYRHTREKWDQEQREWEEHNKRFETEWNERKRLGVTDSMPSAENEDCVWQSSFCVGDNADVPLGIRVFGIGCHLAELIVALRGDADAESEDSASRAKSEEFETLTDGSSALCQAEPVTAEQGRLLIDQLNRDFGNLRELLQTSESSLAEALIHPVLDRFADTLATAATARPDLASKCESLAEELTRLLERPPPEPDYDIGDFDIPF